MSDDTTPNSQQGAELPQTKTDEGTDAPQAAPEAINFIAELKAGKKLAREGWNGKGMFIFLVPGSSFKVNRPPLLGIYPEGTEINYHAHIDMKTADGQIVPWLASQTDLLAVDWIEIKVGEEESTPESRADEGIAKASEPADD